MRIKFLFLIVLSFIAVPVQAEERSFAGINFGIGISLTMDTGSNDRVESAIIDEAGIVRVSSDQNDIARVMLETHYFFEPKDDGKSFLGMADPGKWGHGPFVALQPGTDEIIEAIGLGWMVGFRRNATGSDSWNLGLGYVVDPSVQVLGEGIEADEPLPAGETQIRFRETSQGGVLLLASFTF